ncbi:MAG: glycosyltransferase family 4 protein [Rhodoferax sp.]
MLLKPLLLNSYDTAGGAAIATNRLHRGFLSVGVDSRLLVMHQSSGDPSVIMPDARNLLQKIYAYIPAHLDERITRQLHASGAGLFSPARRPDQLAAHIRKLNPDLIHLFWINSGFVQIESLKRFNKPIVWTLHDMWPFTGGCHYDNECRMFQKMCGSCPALASNNERDLSRQIWKRKFSAWKDIPIVVVATSRWIAEMAQSSSLFKERRIEVIPNGIDTQKYKPLDKTTARAAFNLPVDKKLLLFTAFGATTDRRKGNHFLEAALKRLSWEGWSERIELVVVGASPYETPPDLGMKVHFLGNMQDEVSQVLLYSAADATIAPSMQENLSNAVMESLSCGTPVIAFDIGGMPDMISHLENGYLARHFVADELAEGIKWVLESGSRHERLSRGARQTVLDRFDVTAVAHRYLSLYQTLIH